MRMLADVWGFLWDLDVCRVGCWICIYFGCACGIFRCMHIVGGFCLGVLGVAWLLVVLLVCILGDQFVWGVAYGGHL